MDFVGGPSNILTSVDVANLWGIVLTAIVVLGLTLMLDKTEYRAIGRCFLFIFIAFIFSYVSAMLANATAIPEASLQSFLSQRPILILCLLFAILFYRLRGTNPFLYGMTEMLVGWTTISFAVRVSGGDVMARLISVTGGVYIIIRGMDNMERGLPRWMASVWSVIFPKHRP